MIFTFRENDVKLNAPIVEQASMDHATAHKLMSIYERMGAVMNEADPLLRTLPEAERKVHLLALGEMMGDLWFKLQLPIVREHRDLDPDGDRFWKKPGA